MNAPDFHNAATLEGAGDLTVFPDGLAKPTKPTKPTWLATVNSCWRCSATTWRMRARWWSASRATRPAYPRKVWFGRPWQGNTEVSTSLPASANNYFSLAVFRPDEAGQYRRQKARFHALHAVMLDDVGTKVAMERLTLPPSWLLETSPGTIRPGICSRTAHGWHRSLTV